MTWRVSPFTRYRCERCDPDNLLPTTLCPTICSTKGILLLKTLYPNRVGMRTFSVAGKPVRLFLPPLGKFPWHWGPTSPWSSLRAVHWEDRCYNWQAPNTVLVAGQGPACSSEPHLTASPFFHPHSTPCTNYAFGRTEVWKLLRSLKYMDFAMWKTGEFGVKSIHFVEPLISKMKWLVWRGFEVLFSSRKVAHWEHNFPTPLKFTCKIKSTCFRKQVTFSPPFGKFFIWSQCVLILAEH